MRPQNLTLTGVLFPSGYPADSTRQRTEVRAKTVRPDDNCENRLPKSQVEKADGEEPCGEPHRPIEGVLFVFSAYPLPANLFPLIPSATAIPPQSTLFTAPILGN